MSHSLATGRASAGTSARAGISNRTKAPFTPCCSARQSTRNVTFNNASTAASYQHVRHLRSLVIPYCSAGPSVEEAVAAPSDSAAAAPAESSSSPITAIDIRIGNITKCDRHPDADSLYVEEVDVGEPEPRTIVSGLVQYVPVEQMQDRKVVVLCNLKPRNMRGIKSNGMLLCASNDAHDAVEPLLPPTEAPVGERVWFGHDNKLQPAPAEPNRVQKKKLWEVVQPDLKTDADRVAGFKGLQMLTSAGPVTASTLAGANIS
eukprot:jgi/Chrzof1/11661/Cz06g04060.t1